MTIDLPYEMSPLNKLKKAISHLGQDARFNERTLIHDMRIDGEWVPIDDRFAARIIHEHLPDNFQVVKAGKTPKYSCYQPKKGDFLEQMDAFTHDKSIDPFKQWLEALPEIELNEADVHWIGIEELPEEDIDGLHIDNFFHDLFKQEPEDFKNWGVSKSDDRRFHAFTSRYIYLAIVHRTMNPGCTADQVPIISGTEGTGKDEMFRSMFPLIDGKLLYTESLSFDTDPKEKIYASTPFSLILYSEMSGLKYKELNQIKQEVTRKVDNFRPVYGRTNMQVNRKWIMACTSNNDHPVPSDPTSALGRRWLPIPIQQPQALMHIPDWYMQKISHPDLPHPVTRLEYHWIEAMALYRKNPDPNELRMPPNIKRIQELKVKAFTSKKNEFDDQLQRIINKHKIPAGMPFTSSAIATALKMIESPSHAAKISFHHANSIEAMMNASGYKKFYGKTIYVNDPLKQRISKDKYKGPVSHQQDVWLPKSQKGSVKVTQQEYNDYVLGNAFVVERD